MKQIKRSDRQYIEVEEFADYELTQCITYEMMARDSYHKKLADEVVGYYNENKDSIETCLKEDLSKNILATKQSDGSIEIEIIEKNNIRGSGSLSELTLLIAAIPLLRFEYSPRGYKDPRLGDDFWHIKDKVDRYHGRVEFQPFQDTELIKDRHGDFISVIRREYREGYLIETELSTPIETEEEEQISNLNEYSKYLNREDLYDTTSNITVIQSPKRPEVPTEEFKTISPELTVNLNRPLKEIIALITHIKKDIDENKLVISPIELLGESLEVSDAQPLRKKLADKFFVYDYVKARLEQIEKFNDETKKTFSEEVQQIKDNDNFSDEYKKYLINNAKEELKDGLYSTNINEIFDDEELKSVVSQGTAKRYYYEMKSYIEDKKYKELITGTHT